MDVRNDHDRTKIAGDSGKNESGARLYSELDSKRDDALNQSRQAADTARPPASTESSFLPPYIIEEMVKRGTPGAVESGGKKPASAAGRFEVDPPPGGPGHGEREVYDAKNGYANPGSRARFEGDAATGIDDVDKVYEYTGFVRDFYKKEFGLDSIDGKGMKVVSTVNYGENYANAVWDQNQMFYGHPADNSIFKSFVQLDVTGHEMTHGITEYQSRLWHWDQAGALDESLSDCFGAMVEQYARHQTASEADWIHGKGVFKPDVHARGVRDLLNPGTAFDDPRIGKDPQPAHMKDFVKGSKDNGFIHVNSGIPNRAFALFARSVGGYSWNDPGHIWFAARKTAGNNPTFGQFAYQTIEQAKVLGHADEVDKLKQAWDAVGVVPAPTASATDTGVEATSPLLKKAG